MSDNAAGSTALCLADHGYPIAVRVAVRLDQDRHTGRAQVLNRDVGHVEVGHHGQKAIVSLTRPGGGRCE
jgi:hypothetical protein